MWILCYLIPLLGFYFYCKNKKVEAFFCLTNYRNFFNLLDTKSVPFDVSYIAGIVVALILLIEYKKDIHLFSIKAGLIHKTIFLMLLFFIIEFFITIILDRESIFESLKVFSGILPYFLFFLMRNLSYDDFLSYFKLIFVFCCIQLFLYYLQFIGINILYGTVNIHESLEESRYRNGPQWSPLIIIFLIFKRDIPLSVRVFFILSFGGCMVFAQNRTPIIALGVAISLVFVIKKEVSYWYYTIGAYLIYLFVIAPVFENRAKNESDVYTDITTVIENSSDIVDNYNAEECGTLSFRIAMIFERFEYIQNYPEYLYTGIGYIRESSSHNNFHFIYRTSDNSMLSSADTDWCEIVLRYGVIGIMLYIFFLIAWIVKGLKLIARTDNPVVIAVCAFSVYVSILSFGAAPLHRMLPIILVSLCFMCISEKLKMPNT